MNDAAQAENRSDSPIKGSATSEIVVVSGLPRSGTSMMMQMLEAGGIPPLTDAVRAADGDNPAGYYEYERVKQLDKGDTGWLHLAEGKAVKVISALLPFLPTLYNYRVIFMERDIVEVLASQSKMLVRRGSAGPGPEDGQLSVLFEKHLAQTRRLLQQRPDTKVLYIQHRDVIADAAAQAQRICAFLERPLDVERMAGAVNERLYRNRGK